MVGICFGHQIMADALGGDVRKAEQGWGLGRHVYAVTQRPKRIGGDLPEFAIACSHQDQVIVPPADAEVFLASGFTPECRPRSIAMARAMSLQPHPGVRAIDYAPSRSPNCVERQGRRTTLIEAALAIGGVAALSQREMRRAISRRSSGVSGLLLDETQWGRPRTQECLFGYRSGRFERRFPLSRE